MLTEREIASLKPKAGMYRVSDGQSLFVQVAPTGSKLWRMRYRFGGTEKALALGSWPDVAGAAARRAAGEARQLLQDGKDPAAERRQAKAVEKLGKANTFKSVAEAWQKKTNARYSEATLTKHDSFFRHYIFACIGERPIGELKAMDVLAVVRKAEQRKAYDVAKRTWNLCSRVFKFGVASGLCDRDPTRDVNLTDLVHQPPVKHRGAITDPEQLAGLLKSIDGFDGTFVVKCALQLSAMLAVRPGELRLATWDEIDLDAAEWTIPAKRMKMKLPLTVPLSTQALALFRDLKEITSYSKYVFPGLRTGERAMSENALCAALRRMGYSGDEMTAHGFRAAFRTIADEVLGERPDLLEAQLAHAVRDANGRAYNRTSYLTERRALMQRWSDFLTRLRQS